MDLPAADCTLFFRNAFFIFLIGQYMRTLPVELDEAARIDGCVFPDLLAIILPLILPVLSVVCGFPVPGSLGDLPDR